MFCSQCGEKLGENEKFCHKCGTPVYRRESIKMDETDSRSQKVHKSSAARKGNKKRIGILAGAVVCVICIFTVIRLVGNGNYKTPVKVLMAGIEKQDLQQAMSVFFPEEVEKQLGVDMDGVVDILENSMLKELTEELGVGEDFSIDYKITDVEQCEKDDIKEMEDCYNDMLQTNIQFKDAKELEIEIVISGDGEKEENIEDVTVIKVGNKWYFNIVEMM